MITQFRLKELLDYLPDTGEFVWKISHPRAGKGRIAGAKDYHGYVVIRLDTVLYKAHRLAWLYVKGEWPEKGLDHINQNKSDNRIENLEWVTRKENVLHAIAAGRRHYPEKVIKGINIRTGRTLTFKSQIDAEITLRGKQTGGISAAMKRNKPAYGYVWWYA